jgi:hypothetical protein
MIHLACKINKLRLGRIVVNTNPRILLWLYLILCEKVADKIFIFDVISPFAICGLYLLYIWRISTKNQPLLFFMVRKIYFTFYLMYITWTLGWIHPSVNHTIFFLISVFGWKKYRFGCEGLIFNNFVSKNLLKFSNFYKNLDIRQNLHILQKSYHSLTIVIFFKNL